MAANPQSKYRGWCHASHNYLAGILGVTKQTIVTMNKNLREKELIEVNSTGKLKKTTAKWYNAIHEHNLKLNTSFANIRCFYCDISILEADFEMDHFIPKADGGLDNPENLVIACVSCNHAKGPMNGNKYLELLGKEILPSDYGRPKNHNSETLIGKKNFTVER